MNQNNARIFLPVDDVTTTKIQPNQPLSISYGGYVRILDAASATGIVDIGTYQTVRLLDVSENYIGTAIVKDLTSSIARINSNDLNLEDNGRLYIFGIRMKDNATEFASVKYVKLGTGATGKIEIEPILRGVQNSRLVFEIGQNYLKGISDIQLYIRKKATISLDAGSSQAIIIPAAGEVFTSTSLDRIIAVSMNNTRLTVTNRALVSNNLTATISASIPYFSHCFAIEIATTSVFTLVVDVCAGSGVVAISIAKQCEKYGIDAEIVAVKLS